VKKLVPSIFTSFNLLCGFFAILCDDIRIGSIFILCSLFFDAFDGLVARMLNVSSEIGKELDSLSDLVSFGVAPAYLYILISPFDNMWKYVPASIYVVAAAVRLAKFNLLPASKYFKGMPTPTAAFFLIGVLLAVYYGDNFIYDLSKDPAFYAMTPIILSGLMNSNMNMFSLKSVNSGMFIDKLFPASCFLVFLLLLITNPELALPVSTLCYLTLSLVHNVMTRNR